MCDFSRQACFNELSFCGKVSDDDALALFRTYGNAIKALKKKGFDGVLYSQGVNSLHSVDGCSIYKIKDVERNLWSWILTTARTPYFEDDSPQEARFVEESYETEVAGEWIDGEGFSAAYILDTITVSLDTHPAWRETSYRIRRKGEDGNCGEVLNIFSADSADGDALKAFIEAHTPIRLDKCNVAPELKKCSFRDDHGKDKLMSLWKCLRNCEYIESAINSLPFNSNGRDFIEKCFDDGKIHIRLTDSEKGYGMVVQTTGRDLRTTSAIAEFIRHKYS